MACRCDVLTPAAAQTLCAECRTHRVARCAKCGTLCWWMDLWHAQGIEYCAACYETDWDGDQEEN